MSTWTLYVTDRVGVRQAIVDVYESAEVIARANDVSSWRLTLPTDTEAGQVFATDTFARLEVALDEVAWRSGPVTHLERTVDLDGDMLVVAGVDDTIWLQRRLAHPQPNTSQPPYSQSAYYTITSSAALAITDVVQVNAGERATPNRRVPGLHVPNQPVAGPTITLAARWQNLLTFLQDAARGAGLIFDIIDLTWSCYLPADAGVIFSAGLETLGAWTLAAPAPTANKIVVGGGGEGTARVIRDVIDPVSVATWGLAEQFQDRRDSTDPAVLDQAGLDTLAGTVAPTTVVFTPLDTEGQSFGRDWNLGDLVTVVAGGLTVHDQIREIHVTLDAAGVTITPSVGAPAGDLALFRALAGLDRRVRQLERV